MIFTKKATTIFLDPSSLNNHHKDSGEKFNLILSPSMYWVKKISLPVKYTRDVLKLLPSVFEDTIPDANYSYSAYKRGEEFFVFAYKDKQIIDTLSKIGLNPSAISNIYFAQSEFFDIQTPILINDSEVLYKKDDLITLIPSSWVEISEKLELDNLKLSKHKIRLKQYEHLVDSSSFYKMAASLLILFILIFAEYSILMKSVIKTEKEKIELHRKYHLRSTMLQNRSMLKKYKQIYLKQTKLREYISYLLSYKLNKSEKLLKITLQNNILKAEFSALKNLKAINVFLKSKKVDFKSYRKKSIVYLELIL